MAAMHPGGPGPALTLAGDPAESVTLRALLEEFDIAQAFANTLLETWKSQDSLAPQATVVRVEEPMPGVVVGEL